MAGKRSRWALACALLASLPAPAADIGGWYAERQKSAAHPATDAVPEGCVQALASANRNPTDIGAYRAALCYLQAEAPDMTAVRAWLSRSAELGFLPAQRMLRALPTADAGSHTPMAHCHDLGEGRQVCHGGAPEQPLAAVPQQ
jgi:hypothetical protein